MSSFMDMTKVPIRLTYRAVGSSVGQSEFLGADLFGASSVEPFNDFGSGDIPMSKSKHHVLKQEGIEMVHLPYVLGAISLFHNIPNVPDGPGGLNLTSCVIAQIFGRKITTWDDPAIIKLNENLATLLPRKNFPIKVARRVHGSSSRGQFLYFVRPLGAEWIGYDDDYDDDGGRANYGTMDIYDMLCPTLLIPRLTFYIPLITHHSPSPLPHSLSPSHQYLNVGCESEWKKSMVGKEVDWPSDTMLCEGSGGMTSCIRDNEGAIGYIDAGHGHEEGLVEIELQNADGAFLSSKRAGEEGGIGGAAKVGVPASADEDFSGVKLLNQVRIVL